MPIRRTTSAAILTLAIAATSFAVPGQAHASPESCTAGNRITVIGDSLTDESRNETLWVLNNSGFRVVKLDAVPGRQAGRAGNFFGRTLSSGITAVTNARARNTDCWVIGLGANDAGFGEPSKYASYIDRTMKLIPKGDQVFWLDVWFGDQAYTGNPGAQMRAAAWNIALADATNRWPQLAYVDWATTAQQPDVLEPDTLHLTDAGNLARVDVILTALRGANA